MGINIKPRTVVIILTVVATYAAISTTNNWAIRGYGILVFIGVLWLRGMRLRKMTIRRRMAVTAWIAVVLGVIASLERVRNLGLIEQMLKGSVINSNLYVLTLLLTESQDDGPKSRVKTPIVEHSN